MATALHVPAFVNYNCQLCGWCCHQYDITFSRADYERLSKYPWGELEPALAGKEWCAPLKDSATPDQYRLRYAEDGACVFLGADGLCRMHQHVGELGKTLGCCVYPFTFAGTPTGVYVGLRFSCRAVAWGMGESLARQEKSIRDKLALCAKSGHVPQYGETVVFDGRETLLWSDYLRLEETLIRVFLRDDLPLVRRLLMAHKVIDILRSARLDRVRGARFRDLIGILEAGLQSEAQADPLPGGAGGLSNTLFRQFCFLFQRRQGGSYREMGWTGKLGARMKTFWTGLLFALGAGAPRLVAMPGAVPLAKIAAMKVPPLGHAEEIAISRFLAAKLYGKQHFGKLFFNYSVLQGLEFLILSAGAIMWYARAHALASARAEVALDDVIEAIRYVDFCYGYSSAPALVIERMRVRLLSHRDTAVRVATAQF